MFDKNIVELQKGCPATCVVILKEKVEELESNLKINSNISDYELSENIKNIGTNEDLKYLIIDGIDEIAEKSQDRFYQIVKDREYFGNKLPNEIIIVLTVNEKEGLKNIFKELYNLCVVVI